MNNYLSKLEITAPPHRYITIELSKIIFQKVEPFLHVCKAAIVINLTISVVIAYTFSANVK